MNEKEFITELKKLNIEVTPLMLERLEKYYNLLIEYNQKINLTRITEKQDVYLKHFYDSITLIKAIDLNQNLKVCDIGTGAGFPGLVLKIVFPNLQITLVDALNKRINFLNDVKEKIKLENMEAIHSRAEEFCQNKKYREKFDIAVSRAVANLSVLAEYLLPAVKVGGQVICMKGSQVEEELNDAKFALKELGGKIKSVDEFFLPGTDMKRNVIIVEKIKETPKKYPRKAGTPAKQPLK